MTVIYHEQDGDLDFLSGKRVGVIGYGNLGRPIALNLRDSGLEIRVGVRSDQTRDTAMADGMNISTIEEVVKEASILMMMMPDEVMPSFYLEQISPHLQRGQM